jgi:hypothetical protein
VDEGPGLSGSSFTSVAEKLNELGVSDEQIVLFPSHEPDVASLVSERARARWPKHRIYFEPFHAEDFMAADCQDLCGGKWRGMVGCNAAVQPQHERRKYLRDGVLRKFSGLAHYGTSRLVRARELAASGFVPEPLGLCDGFLLTRWVDGTPADSISEELIDTMASYLACLADRYDSGREPDLASLTAMIRANTGLECAPPPYEGTEVAIDGRMLPHEWIRTGSGWVKADALDHHDDHFFPGCQDIAWDVAGAGVEFGFDPLLLAARLARLTGDRTLSSRLPFYRTAYLAWRIGYCALAARTLGDSDDGRAFLSLQKRYTAALQPPAMRPISSLA